MFMSESPADNVTLLFQHIGSRWHSISSNTARLVYTEITFNTYMNSSTAMSQLSALRDEVWMSQWLFHPSLSHRHHHPNPGKACFDMAVIISMHRLANIQFFWLICLHSHTMFPFAYAFVPQTLHASYTLTSRLILALARPLLVFANPVPWSSRPGPWARLSHSQHSDSPIMTR